MQEFTLTKGQRLVTNAASDDESRPTLTRVCIRKGIIEATDGYILVQKYIDYDGEPILLDANELSKCKDGRNSRFVTFSLDNGKVTAAGESTMVLSTWEETFPDTDGIFPKGKPVLTIGLNKNKLMQLLKCFDKDETSIVFTFYKPGEPVGVSVPYVGRGLIMPLNLDYILKDETKTLESDNKENQ